MNKKPVKIIAPDLWRRPFSSIFQKQPNTIKIISREKKRQRERIVYFSGSRIVTNDFRQFDIGFDFGNREDPNAFLRTAPRVAKEESIPDPPEHVKRIGYSQLSYCV
jgi:hypothetical protein